MPYAADLQVDAQGASNKLNSVDVLKCAAAYACSFVMYRIMT